MTPAQKKSLRQIAAKIRKLARQDGVSDLQIQSLADELIFEIEEDGHEAVQQNQA